jgi:Outer membrane protein Omp28
MKKTNFIYFIIIAFIGFSGCDKLDGPTYFEENTIIVGDTVNKILIEEFTGHKCGNCPRAHEKIEQLKSLYGDAIIPVAFHVGFFALPSTSGDEFTADFRTVPGDVLDSYFNMSNGAGLPSGLVNRIPLENNVPLYHEDWASVIEQRTSAPVQALMTLDCEYSSETDSLHIQTSVKFLEDISNDIKIVLYIIEDNIVDWQKDYDHDPVDIENYTHRHVFRDAINSAWGENLVTTEVSEGELFNKTHKYVLNDTWIPENCEVIAYIYNAETLKIIQVEHEKVIP